MDIRNGNCLELLKTLPDKSVDLFICDLPYGETNCKWDTKINMEQFWKEFKRVRKSKKTACIHFCSTKFGYKLIQSWESGFKMDMVWKKRNKTGGIQSRLRPMRNHEMVYFFYEQAPKYNRDKYHKRIAQKKHDIEKECVYGDTSKMGTPENHFEPPNPASVVEEEEKPKRKSVKDRKGLITKSDLYPKENQTTSSFDPPNPSSVLEEQEKTVYGISKEDCEASDKGIGVRTFEPPNPGSVVEETDIYGETKSAMKERGKEICNNAFEPPNPASVVEENPLCYGMKKFKDGGDCGRKNEDGSYKQPFEPPNPASVLEEDEDEPVSMYESTKVFIGKRHHQTEKPLDILEFFLKYWTDEDEVVCDPTMGSGSTGVACKKMKRKFIGFELEPKIFEVAKKRIESV